MNKKFLSLVLSLVMVLGTFTSVFAASETVKKDEKATEKVEKVEKITGKDNKIQYIIDKKFVEGYGDGEFGYDKNIKRSEITKLLVFANGHKDLSEKLQGTMKLYKDVDTAYWANGVIAVGTTVPSTSNNQAMLNGYPDGNFLPENNVTYAELSKMLVVLVKEDLTADDVKKANANWAGQWMSWAAQLGILDDVTVADSNAAATRADAFTMLYNALYKMQSFKRVPANEELGVLSDLSNKKLTLNQDKDQEYTITDDTVFIKHTRNLKDGDNDNVVKVSSVRNPEYYLGSLVRIMYNDKKEITHILELGNPEFAALSNKKATNEEEVTLIKDNDRWDGVADGTVATHMSNITSLKDYKENELKSYVTFTFDDEDVDTIKFFNKDDEKAVAEVEVNDDTKVFIANPRNNQMKKVEDIDRAMSLIGYKNIDNKIPNVYVGFDDDSVKGNVNVNTTNKDLTAKVVVFNVVSKNNDKSEKYRVINETSSKGVSILEDVDAKKYEENDFRNANKFPYNYGKLNDVIELRYAASDDSYNIERLIKADKTELFPIVKVTKVKEDRYVSIEDTDGKKAILDIKGADIFTGGKVERDDYIQFKVVDKTNEASIVSIRKDIKKDRDMEGSIRDIIENAIEKDQVTGKVISVRENTVTIDVDKDFFDGDLKAGNRVFNHDETNEELRALKAMKGKKVSFLATKEGDDNDKYFASDFKLTEEQVKEDAEAELATAIAKVEYVEVATADEATVKAAVVADVDNTNVKVEVKLIEDDKKAEVTLTHKDTNKKETKTIEVSVLVFEA